MRGGRCALSPLHSRPDPQPGTATAGRGARACAARERVRATHPCGLARRGSRSIPVRPSRCMSPSSCRGLRTANGRTRSAVRQGAGGSGRLDQPAGCWSPAFCCTPSQAPACGRMVVTAADAVLAWVVTPKAGSAFHAPRRGGCRMPTGCGPSGSAAARTRSWDGGPGRRGTGAPHTPATSGCARHGALRDLAPPPLLDQAAVPALGRMLPAAVHRPPVRQNLPRCCHPFPAARSCVTPQPARIKRLHDLASYPAGTARAAQPAMHPMAFGDVVDERGRQRVAAAEVTV